jgi:hypothetical protein
LITSAVHSGPLSVIFTFDHDVALAGNVPQLVVNGLVPNTTTTYMGLPNKIECIYPGLVSVGNAWSLMVTPSNLTSPGRVIPVPQGGTVA